MTSKPCNYILICDINRPARLRSKNLESEMKLICIAPNKSVSSQISRIFTTLKLPHEAILSEFSAEFCLKFFCVDNKFFSVNLKTYERKT